LSKDGWYKRKKLTGGFYPEWRKRYINEFGKKDEFKGYTDKELSRRAFNRELDRVKESIHKRRLGIPETSEKPIKEIIALYLKWGKREGGKGGRPWADKWAENVELYLLGSEKMPGLIDRIGINRLDAITLHAFETALSAWENPKSRMNIGSILKTFLTWCRKRKMLADNPLEFWPGKKMESGNKVRALTPDELIRILSVSPPSRALGYEFAVYGGARAGEFIHILTESLVMDRGGIFLQWSKTKAKKDHFFYLPADYMERLKEHARRRLPKAPLFDMGKRMDKDFHKDREAAGIPYMTSEGKCTFHSLRHTHNTLLGYVATDSATEMDMGRHSDARTRRIYWHSHEESKRTTIEKMKTLLDGRNGDTQAKSGNGK
jgi:integrase